jgi:hypothetical protein
MYLFTETFRAVREWAPHLTWYSAAESKETKDKIKDHKNSNGMMQSQDNLTNSKHVEIEIKL